MPSPLKKNFSIFDRQNQKISDIESAATSGQKRFRFDVESDNDESSVMDFLKSIKNDTTRIKRDIDEQAEELRKLRLDLNTKFGGISDKVENLSSKVESIDDEIKILRNEFEQSKLLNCMDITGVEKSEVENFDKMLMALVLKIFSNFNITIDPELIERVYKRYVKGGSKAVIVVVFKDFKDKLKAMKKKRESTTTTNIYFDHSMTGETRKLFVSAKKLNKDTGYKTFLISGKIFVLRGNDSKIQIKSESDLENLKQPTKPLELPSS